VITIRITNQPTIPPAAGGLPDDDSGAYLYTTATHGGIWIVYTIEAAFFVIKKLRSEGKIDTRSINVTIFLLPVYSTQLNPLRVLSVGILKKIFSMLPGLMKNHFPETLKLKLSSEQSGSFYNQIYSGNKVTLHKGPDTLTFSLLNTLSLKYIFNYYRSYLKAIILWTRCYQRFHFDEQKFLHLEYHNAHIGDLAASTTLRAKSQFGGSLKPCFDLFCRLANGICICDIAATLPFKNSTLNYAFFPESTFLHFAYQRTLENMGSWTIHNYLYNTKFDLLNPGQKWKNGFFVHPPENGECNPEETKKVDDYMDIRLYQAGQKLSYMLGRQNENLASDIKDISGNPVKIDKNGLNVLIFLHSFDDEQFLFGLDGFNDLYHWVIFTIDHCLGNSRIDKILVKPHPCDNPKRYPADKVAFENLQKRYLNDERVVFIEKSSSIVFLAKSTHIFGITHHGSIAEEFVYLHQPVIASVFAPWQSNFSFIRTWKDPEEYGKLLDSLSIDTWSPPDESELKSLCAFILDYRLNDHQIKITFEQKSRWRQFVRLYSGESVVFSEENFDKYEKIFRDLSVDDPVMKEFIDLLYETEY
jgi:hypothetical protein